MRDICVNGSNGAFARQCRLFGSLSCTYCKWLVRLKVITVTLILSNYKVNSPADLALLRSCYQSPFPTGKKSHLPPTNICLLRSESAFVHSGRFVFPHFPSRCHVTGRWISNKWNRQAPRRKLRLKTLLAKSSVGKWCQIFRCHNIQPHSGSEVDLDAFMNQNVWVVTAGISRHFWGKRGTGYWFAHEYLGEISTAPKSHFSFFSHIAKFRSINILHPFW